MPQVNQLVNPVRHQCHSNSTPKTQVYGECYLDSCDGTYFLDNSLKLPKNVGSHRLIRPHVLNSCIRKLDHVEILNRLNGNYNGGEINSCAGIGLGCCHCVSYNTNLDHRPHSDGNVLSKVYTSTQFTKAELGEVIFNRTESYRNNISSTCRNCNTGIASSSKCSLATYTTSKCYRHANSSAAPIGRIKSSTTQYQYLIRKQQRTRKCGFNVFMHSALYRQQHRIENNYIIYHNPMEDPDATYTSFSNPNYFFNRARHHNNNNNATTPNGNTSGILADKLRLNTDYFDNHGAFSDYSSCEPTPTTPDRTLILQKLHSPSDDDDDDDDDDDNEDDKRYLVKADGDSDSSQSNNEEPRMYVGVGSHQVRRSRGILGYLEMLEKQALQRESRKFNNDNSDEEDGDDKEKDDDEKEDAPKTMQGGDQPVEPPPNEIFDHGTEINSPDSNDSGIQAGEKTPILSPDTPGALNVPPIEDVTQPIKQDSEVLPEGWEKHEDDDGAYYWHVKSGTIQRDPPPPAPPDGPALCSPRSISLTSESSSSSAGSIPSTPTSTNSGTEHHLAEFEGHALQYAANSLQSLSTLSEKKPQETSSDKTVRFAVRSLGWVKIAEEDLSPDRSSKAVNKCIVDLSLGRNDINDAVGRWGDGKDLFMDLDHTSLRLVDPVDGVVLNSQPIHSIRVWGVGRDNGRDFAYVARDRGTRIHMCHVFHCDTPARQIANTLRDICKKIMLERSLHQSAVARLMRPTDLPNLDKVSQPNGEKLSFQNLYNNARFPTPMEEPRKVMRCHYLGTHEVIRPTGRDILNEAIQYMYYRIPPEKWKFVNVAIAPSTITITEHGNPDGMIEECRVRFLSFMGIAVDNVKLCAFIMHTSQNKFICHVFHCEPSAGPMCKTIEAACKLRYQKCLDAHPQTPKGGLQGKHPLISSLRSSIKQSIQCVWGSVTQLTSPK
ncbi:amyloid beta precursor protein binding family B member 2-like isoform X2 [Biomphalaria glabrata]|uniref:Amyloid beta precursor protein binding family B member 2-like isoform X2 n=1 Tax=Biomphalaria glabrata TaxID=6526 RepID=A0A9W3B7P2_BIOGL|nr:amyloid beta precursor protein binding family B member 2-like isoform X2 [Biomphalaria glabrata]